MAYLLVVDLQPEFVKDSPGKLVYQRCLDYINYCGSNYDEVIAAVYKNTDSKNMHALVRWDEMQKIQKIEFKPTKMYVHSGYSIGNRLNFNEHTKVDVIGFDTDACVLSTCFDLFNMDTNFRILANGCWSSGGVEMHEHGLAIMRRQFNRALDTETLLDDITRAQKKVMSSMRR